MQNEEPTTEQIIEAWEEFRTRCPELTKKIVSDWKELQKLNDIKAQ